MSRLEKAMEEKKKGKRSRNIIIFLFIVFAVILLLFLLGGELLPELFGAEPDLIDRESTMAFIDMFDLNYVRVYLQDGVVASEVFAGDKQFIYNDEYGRWDLVTSGFQDGDQVTVTVVAADENGSTQEVSLTFLKH